LYLRCIGDTATLLKYCEPHLEDETMFRAVSDANSRMMSVSDWLLSCVTDHKYYGTVLRRIPVPVVRAFERKGVEIQVKKERGERIRKFLTKGLRCRARWTDGQVYDAIIQQVLETGKYLVLYTEYGNEEEICVGDFEVDSVMKADESKRSPSPERRDRKRSRDRSRSRSRSRSRDRDKRSELPELSLEEEIEARIKKMRDSDKSSATTSDGRYCAQIVSYKKSLSQQFKGGQTFENTNKKLDIPDPVPRGRDDWRDRDRGRDRRRERSPSPVKKKELTQEQKMKQAALLAKYGDIKK